MKINLLRSAFILTILPVTSLFSSQPGAQAAASGAVSPQPGAAAVVESQPGIFDDLIAAADASAAQKQASPSQPAGMPDLLASAAAQAEGAPANSHPVALADLYKKESTPDAEGQQAALDSLKGKDQKQKAENATTQKTLTGAVTGVVAGAISGVYQAARTGVKYFKDSNGRKLLDRFEQCERDKKEFASGSAGQDTSLIALGVQDSLDKAVFDPKKSENIAKMITGIYCSKAKADPESRRNLRKFVTSERDAELQELEEEFNLRIKALVRWYREGTKVANEKEMLRKLTYEFQDCHSDDDEDLSLISPDELKANLNKSFTLQGNKVTGLHTIVKRDKKPSVGDKKLEKPAASAAAKPVASPAAAAGNAVAE